MGFAFFNRAIWILYGEGEPSTSKGGFFIYLWLNVVTLHFYSYHGQIAFVRSLVLE